MYKWMLGAVLAAFGATTAAAQIAPKAPEYVRYREPVIVLTHVKLVDGTGAPARKDVTVVLKDGRISAVGPAKKVVAPAGATVIDGRGKTVLPGFVMMHEHMFYPTGYHASGYADFNEMLHSFPPLYIAGGVTTLRTAGTLNVDADLSLRDAVAAGKVIGADMDVTAPYVDGPGVPVLKMPGLKTPEAAEQLVNYWADRGATSVKIYVNISPAAMQRAIDTAHRRGMKVTGHLCSVTYREAADMGIDNLEHGFFPATDFLKEKKPGVCPDFEDNFAGIDPDGPEATALIRHLIARKVALTSTLTVFETGAPGRPKTDERALSVLMPTLRANYEALWALSQDRGEAQTTRYKALMRMERRFVEMGGTLIAGTDPTGAGGVIPGFASKRQVQLLVEAGFGFEEAVKIATLNGATFLGRQREIGTVEAGKRADLILVDGDPLSDPGALDRMPIVFKAGVGYDAEAIIGSLQGAVGLN